MSEPTPEPAPPEGVPDLRRWLGYGMLAAVIAAGLGVTSSALALGGGQQGGFGPPEVLGLVGLLPLGVVAAAYSELGRHAGTTGLRRSALGFFGMLVLLTLGGLNVNDAGPRWWNVVIWLALAVATGFFLYYVFSEVGSETAAAEAEAEPPPEPEPAPATADTAEAGEKKGTGVGAVIGGLAALGACFWKIATKVAAIRLLRKMGADGIEAVVLIALLVMAVVFFVWFAVAKIRNRHRLGPLAAVLGVAELSFFLVVGGLIAGAAVDVIEAAEQGGPNAEAAADAAAAAWVERAEWASVGVTVVWAALTAALFRSYRDRLAAGDEWAAPEN